MKKKSLLSILIGGLIYTIVVLINLMLQVSLVLVFKRGIIALIIILLISWIILTLFEILSSNNYNESEKIKKNNKENKKEDSTLEDSEDEIKNFSPLNPTHVEVNKEE